MQLFLPSGSMKVIGSFVHFCTKQIRTFFLALVMITGFLINANAQVAGNEVIKPWTALEEAEFYFDVSFQIVKCNPVASPEIHLLAFNEGGNVDAIGFTLKLTDASGNEATIEVPKFEIGQAEMQEGSCESDENKHLKLQLPDGIDPRSIEIEITYNK